MATLGAKHPTYGTRDADWVLMRHSEAGERTIKSRRFEYLAPSTMMITRGIVNPNQLGWKMYDGYLGRAVYHDICRPALDAMLGVMHAKPAKIEVPAKMKPMLERATFNGDSAQTLLERINEAQLLMGRIGIMLDVKNGAMVNELPYVVTYAAETIENWDTSKVSDNKGFRALQFVVLNETGFERTAGLLWETIVKYRVLAMGAETQDCFPGIPNAPVYCAGGVRQRQEITGADFQPVAFGGATLDSIPFIFVGPKDLVPEPDQPPLLPLARIALAIYRGEADYRQALYLQGQQTLVTIGASTNVKLNPDGTPAPEQEVGASATLELPLGGDAKYIGPNADGMAVLGNSIMEDKRQAAHLGANLLETQGGAAESGDALYIRTSARTSSLTTVAKTGGEALKLLLQAAAKWCGANPDEVIVEPNLEFSDTEVQAQNLVQLMTAKMMGAPISEETVHWFMSQNGFTNKTYDEEKSAMADDPPPAMPLPGRGLSGAPGDSNAKPGGSGPAKDKREPQKKPAKK